MSAHAAPKYSGHLVRELLRLSNHEEAPLPARVLQRMCSKCFALLTPGLNSSATRTARNGKSRRSRQHKLRVSCRHCFNVTTYPLSVVKESSRAGQGASSPAPSAAAARPSSVGATQAKQKKRPTPPRRKVPSPAAVLNPPATSGGFYGFDFVALAP